ncbi:MAG: ester cyclase [Anaerolineae bacterium]
MSVEEDKAIFRRIVEEGFNKGNLAIVDELVATNHVNHTDNVHGPEEYKQFITMYRTAFPDLHMTIEDQIAEGDKVVNRWTSRGTHKGDLMGIPPTGKQTTVTGMYVARIIGGKIVEEWGNFDALGMMQQIGVVPPPGQAGG